METFKAEEQNPLRQTHHVILKRTKNGIFPLRLTPIRIHKLGSALQITFQYGLAKRFLKLFKSRTWELNLFACDLIQFPVTLVIVLCIMLPSSLIRNM